MDFLGGLGNLFHSIGNIITGGGNNGGNNQPPQTFQPNVQRSNSPLPAPLQPANQPSQPAQPNQNTLVQPTTQPKPASLLPVAPNPNGKPGQGLPFPLNQAATLQRVTPAPTTAEPTDDPVGNFVQNLIHPAVQFGHAILETPHAIVREIQNKPIDDIQRNVFGTNDQGQIAKDIIGDTAQIGLTAAAPGVDNLIEKGVGAALPEATTGAEQVVSKLIPKVVSGVAQGGTFGGVQAATNNEDIGTGIRNGALLGGAGAGLLGLPSALQRADTLLPGEVAPGVSSVNPNREADAAEQIAAKQAATNPVGQPGETPVPGQPQITPTTPEQTQLPLNQEIATPPTVQPTAPTGEIQQTVQPGQETPSLPNNVPRTPNDVNTAPNAPNVQAGFQRELGTTPAGEHPVMAKDAMQQQALQTAQNADLAAAIKQHSTTAPVINTPQDAFNASALMRRMYAEAKTDPASMAARNNLASAIADFGTRSGQGTNVMADMTANLPPDAKANVITKSLLKVWGEDNPRMPADLKTLPGQDRIQSTLTEYLEQGEAIQNQMAALEGKLNDLAEAAKGGTSGDAAAQSHVFGRQLQNLQLQSYIKNAEAMNYYSSLVPKSSVAERLAQGARTSMLSGMGGRLNNLGNVAGNSMYEILRGQIQAAIGKAINVATGGDANALDTGLVNSRLATGAATGVKTVAAEAKNGRLVGDVGDTVFNKSGGELNRVNDVLGTSGNNGTSLLNKAGNLVKAAVSAPRNILGSGIRDSELMRLSRQEGQSLGLSGDELKTYTAARSYVPSDSMWQKAQDLQDQVSHTNKNAFSTQIDKWFNTSKLSGTERGIGGLIKNAILPFAKFPATMLYNTITDRNIIADAAHLGVSAMKGDVDGVTKAIAGAIIDGGGGALGWHLAHMGLITNKDANGYSDAGMYLHIGNRFIPLGSMGVGAESLIGGASMALATAAKGGNTLENFVKGIGDTLGNTFRMAGGQSLVGADNQSLAAVQNAATGKETAGDAAATVGGQELGQFIPSITGDINAGLNYSPLNPTGEAAQTKVTKGDSGQLTPTGKISTAKDILPSVEASLINRIPVASQVALPRNPAVAATDLIDRVTRGSHQNGEQAAAAQAKQTAAQAVADDIKNGIPNPSAPTGTYKDAAGKSITFADQVENVVEAGHYDKAIAGLNRQLDALKGQPQTKIEPVQNQIKQLQILQDQKLPPAIRDTYANTSLKEWRNMGDANSADYNPTLYQTLANYDEALAKAGIAGGSGGSAGKSASPKFYAATSGSGSGRSAANLVKNNKIGSLPQLARESFVNNLAAPAINLNLPQAKLTQPSELIKAHKITVGMPKA